MDAAGPADFRDIAASAGLTAKTIIGGDRTKQVHPRNHRRRDGDPRLRRRRVAGHLSRQRRAAREPAGDAAPISHLYRNSGDGTFADVTAKAGIGGRGWGQGVCAGDYDNDGHVDLFVTYYGDQILYRNNGDGTFGDVTRRTGLSLSSPRWNTGCAFVDFNRDGRLDLFVSAYVAYADAMRYAPGSRGNCNWKGLGVMCGPHGLEGSHNMLFRANDDGTFTDVSEAAGLKKARPAFGFTPLVLDYDNDGWPDVYVANDSNASLLFHNDGRRRRSRTSDLQAGVALTADGRAQAGMGVSAGDYDRDGWLDIVKTNFDDDTTSLYRNLGDGTFDDATVAGGLGGEHSVSGLGHGVRRLRSRHLAGHLHRQRPCLSGGRSHRRPLRLRAAEAAVSQSRQRTLRGCVDACRARRARARARRAAPPSATCSTPGSRMSSSTTCTGRRAPAQLCDARGP